MFGGRWRVAAYLLVVAALVGSLAGAASGAETKAHVALRPARALRQAGYAATTAINELPPSAVEQQPPGNVNALPESPNAPDAVSVRVISRAGGGGSPGGLAQFFVVVISNGKQETTAGQPATLTFQVPTGLVFDGVTDVSALKGALGNPGHTGPPGSTWICKPAVKNAGGTSVTCTYGIARGSTVEPVSIPGGAGIASLVRLRVPTAFASATGGTPVTLRSTLSAPGNTATNDQTATATTDVLPGAPFPALVPDSENVPSTVHVGELVTKKLQFLNAGSGPAIGGSGHAAIELANVLPPTLVSSWQASGTGWSCSGPQTSPPNCAFAGTVAAGALSPQLTIQWRVSGAGAAALDIPIGGSARSSWTMDTVSNGARGAQPAVHYPDELLVAAPLGSDLVVEASADGGVQELLPGISKADIELAVTNLGREDAKTGITLAGLMTSSLSVVSLAEKAPAGAGASWTCATKPFDSLQTEFTCKPVEQVDVPPARTLHLTMTVQANAGAKTGASDMRFVVGSSDEMASLEGSIATIPVFILAGGNVGFPGLTLLRAVGAGASPLPATDGAPAAFETGQPFVEQLDVRNAGGADIAAGSAGELFQEFTPGVKVESVRAPAGWSCTPGAGSKPTLLCTFTVGAALAPAAVTPGPQVTLVDGAPTPTGTDWSASVRLTASGAPKALSIPVLVTVTKPKPELLPDLAADTLPTAGGVGRFTLTVQNGGLGGTAVPVKVGIDAPAGAKLEPVTASGWSCFDAPTGRTARCTSTGDAPAGQTLPAVQFAADFPVRSGGRTLSLVAHASAGGAVETASLPVTPKPALQAVIKAPDRSAFVDVPLVSANEKITPTTITLEGDGSGGSGLGLQYTWTQLCTSSASVVASKGRCTSVTPRVTWLGQAAGTVNPTSADVQFSMPTITQLTALVFQLTVTDGSATTSSYVRIRDIPELAPSAGFQFGKSKPPKTMPEGAMAARDKVPAPDEKLVTGIGTLTKPAPKKHAARVVAAEPATTTTTTSTTSTTSTGTTTTTTATPQLPAFACDLVKDAANGSFSKTFPGGIELSAEHVSVSGTGCNADTSVSFSGSSVTFSSFLKATGVDGSIDKNGITLTAGTITGPASWNSPTFSITGDSSIFLAYPGGTSSADNVEAEGSVSGSGLAFIPLPSGWDATTTLTFSVKDGVNTLSIDANATGPANDTSPDSPKPTLEISGSISTDDTFSLAVSAQRVVQLQGHGVELSGSVKRETADGPIAVEATGSLTGPFEIVPGLVVKTLTVKIAPTTDSLGLSGTGTLELAGPSAGLGLGVKLTYDNPKNWSLTADGLGDSTWSPLPGLTLKPSEVHGFVAAKDDTYEFSLDVAPAAPWTPNSSVTVSNVKLKLSNTCPDTGAPCPANTSIFLDASGDAAFTLPSVGTVKTSLRGVLGLPSGAFSVAASLTEPLSLGAGISIDSSKIEISKGMSAPTGEPILAAAPDTSGLQVKLTGSATLPLIGKLPAIEAQYSSSGWAVAANLGQFQLPGTSGDGSKLADTILGWSSFKTSLNVVDPVTKLTSAVELPANTFELSGSFTTPSWLKSLLNLNADVSGRATGKIDTSSGDFSLRMEFALSGNTYIYGSATSATSAKLTTAFFQIEKKASDFNVALGGEASLGTAKTSSLPASDVKLGVALAFSVSTQTISGDFTFNSQAGWRDAFGVRDMTLFDLAVSFQFNISTLTPAIGFGARAVLPNDIRSPLGMPNNVQTTLVANISLTTPCIGIDVTDPTKSGVNVLSLGSGAVTAKEFQFEVAPNGCTVGKFRYDPGLSIAFDGRISGLSVAVAAHVSVSPFAFDAKLDVGAFSVGGVDVQKTHLELSYAGSKFRVAFSGGVSVLGTDVSLAGSLEQNGQKTTIDLNGSLNQLTIANVLSLQGVKVALHVETAPTVNATFKASGQMQLLGSTINADVSLGVKDGRLTELNAKIDAAIFVGGTNGLKLVGRFNMEYGANKPFALDAAVKASIGSYDLGDGTLTVNSSGITFTANFSIGGVFSARLAGAIYYGSVPAGTKIQTPTGLVNATSGDFVISAKDVTLNLGGFKSTGSVTIGKAAGTSFGSLSTTIQLLGSASGNSISIAGSFSGNGDFTFKGSGSLNLLGTSTTASVSVARVSSNVTVHADANVNVLGSSIAFGGDFVSNNGSPLFRLRGNGRLNVAGYNVANANFVYSNFPEDAGLAADINVQAGRVLNFNGRINIVGSLFYLDAAARLDLGSFSADGNAVFTNCNASIKYRSPQPQPWQYPGTTINFGFFVLTMPSFQYIADLIRWTNENAGLKPTCDTALGGAKLDANASFFYGGFSFGVSLHVSPNGDFTATARSPVSGEFHGETGTLDLWVAQFYADINYSMQITVRSGSPPVELSGSGSANVYGRSWEYQGFLWWGWGGWGRIVGISASIQTNPFHACGYVNVWGYDFGGCI
ncbi:MAG: hypothetical protein JO017_05895 [Actinobacteria bacterium]|nr:hypothetical protein [Actinomycetota bacterium]